MNYLTLAWLHITALFPMSILNILALKFQVLLHLFGYRKKVISQNLKNAFPEKSVKERNAIRKTFYAHFGQFLAEVIKMFSISKKAIRNRVNLKNEALIHQYYQEGKDVILVLGHYGNWEWGLLATSIISEHETVGIYKPLSSTFWDKQIKALRSRFGATLVSMQDSGRYLLNKGAKPRIIGIVADQTPAKGELDYWITFLNQDTPVFIGTEKLAKKLNAPVVFVHIDRTTKGNYQMSFELIADNPRELPEGEITNLHTQLLEDKIKSNPAQWLWSHRRWKHSRK
jgi:Kdo2-lipid IVA lauroyltransferase/acyltransferase